MHDMSSVFIVFMMHYTLPAEMTSYVQCSKSQQGALLNVTTFRPRDTNNSSNLNLSCLILGLLQKRDRGTSAFKAVITLCA